MFAGWTMDASQARRNRLDREDDNLMGGIRLVTKINIENVYLRLMKWAGYAEPYEWFDDPKYWATSERK